LAGPWTSNGSGAGTWNFLQADRIISVRWSSAASIGEFHGIVISHDKNSTVEGFYVNISNGIATTPRSMMLIWDPKKPEELKTSIGVLLEKN
jgi:hypothetical protein